MVVIISVDFHIYCFVIDYFLKIKADYIYRYTASLRVPLVRRGCCYVEAKDTWIVLVNRNSLTHWGRDKMADISQTTFSNAFTWMKIHQFRLIFHWSLFLLIFHWSLFLMVKFTIPALVQMMAWRRLGNKPLSEPIMVSLLTHMCVTRPQWVKDFIERNKLISAVI